MIKFNALSHAIAGALRQEVESEYRLFGMFKEDDQPKLKEFKFYFRWVLPWHKVEA